MDNGSVNGGAVGDRYVRKTNRRKRAGPNGEGNERE